MTPYVRAASPQGPPPTWQPGMPMAVTPPYPRSNGVELASGLRPDYSSEYQANYQARDQRDEGPEVPRAPRRLAAQSELLDLLAVDLPVRDQPSSQPRSARRWDSRREMCCSPASKEARSSS